MDTHPTPSQTASSATCKVFHGLLPPASESPRLITPVSASTGTSVNRTLARISCHDVTGARRSSW